MTKGISTPSFSAKALVLLHVGTPSAIIFISESMVSSFFPLPISSPTKRLRLCGDKQVTIKSPIPANPANVCASAPRAIPNRHISACPLVSKAALVLSPDSIPYKTPLAIAITFLTEPQSSTPITSLDV